MNETMFTDQHVKGTECTFIYYFTWSMPA